MIVLNATTKTLEAKLGGAPATNQVPIVVTYVDVDTTTYVPQENDTVTNGVTAVTIASAPGASVQRQIKLITIPNIDTAAVTVILQYNNNGTVRRMLKVTLAVDDTLVYTDGEGFRVVDVNGNVKGSGSGGSIAVLEAGSSVVASATAVDFKDGNVEANGSTANIYHNLVYTPGGRLTLTSGTPITTADVTGATTIYYSQLYHGHIQLYDGTRVKDYTFTELSLALGSVTSGLPYDVFCYDSGGTPTLEKLAWTNDTTRATALAFNNGFLTKSGDATRRCLGSFYTTSTTATEDSRAKRYVSNLYNDVPRDLLTYNTNTTNYTYAVQTYRPFNNDSNVAVSVMICYATAPVHVEAWIQAGQTAASVGAQVGIGVDSTTVSSHEISAGMFANTLGVSVPIYAEYNSHPGVGKHTFTALERVWNTSNAVVFYGNNGAGSHTRSGIFGFVFA